VRVRGESRGSEEEEIGAGEKRVLPAEKKIRDEARRARVM